MRYILFFLVCLLAASVYGQLKHNYIPSPVLDTIPQELYRSLKAELQRDLLSIKEPKSNVKSYIRELYENRCDYVIETFNQGSFIVDTVFTPYLQSILNKIYASNPGLSKRNAKVYAYRSEVSNAISFGEGTIGVTLGLLAKLRTEDQIAFVLCHEIAHYQEEHSDKGIAKRAALHYDKEVRKKLKEIKRSEYEQFTKLSALASEIGVSIAKHSRDKESEADSLALIYYLKTSYSWKAPVQTLQILDSVDIDININNIDFKKYFSFSDYPFKESWISYQKSDRWYASSHQNDSSKTHPNCKTRITELERQLKSTEHQMEQSVLEFTNINRIKEESAFEIIASQDYFGSYGRSLYNTFVLLEQYPENVYLHSMLSRSFYYLYFSQKNRLLHKVLPLPDPRFNEDYDRFLTFANTLRLSEYASLSYHYAMKIEQLANNDQEYLFSLWLASNTEVSKTDPNKIKSAYLTHYPNGKYTRELK